jgi:phosphopantothenoylcysteine synthetase/decarboxylase
MYGADGTIKVGTDLLKENTTRINPYTNNTQTSTPSPSVDISAMVNKMEQMFAKLQDRPVVVHSVVKTENNDVLASATNQSNRKTGYSIQ